MAGRRRGPAPEPAAVKIAKGNSGHRPISTAEDEVAAAEALAAFDGAHQDVKSPSWLNEDGVKVWGELAPRLSAMKILQSIDAHTFGRYCQDFGRWVQLQKSLDDEGTTYESESPHGTYIRAHPAFMQADRLNRSLMVLEASFALNPADRQRLFAARADAAKNPDLFDTLPGEKKGKNGVSPIGALN